MGIDYYKRFFVISIDIIYLYINIIDNSHLINGLYRYLYVIYIFK